MAIFENKSVRIEWHRRDDGNYTVTKTFKAIGITATVTETLEGLNDTLNRNVSTLYDAMQRIDYAA